MRRQRTVPIGKDEVDFMVLEFSCIDNTVLSSIGTHCKETCWKIAIGNGSIPMEIKLHVDKKVITSPQVSVQWDGRKVFPTGTSEKAKLKQDFVWRVPFRGTIKGLSVKDYFEIRPEHFTAERWFTATLVEQRPDGLFKAIAKLPDGKGGFKDVNYPAVKPENIREAGGMKKSVQAPQRTLVLKVPKQDPLHAVLLVDEQELVTHFFARPTPPPCIDQEGAKAVQPRIQFKVSKDRHQVTTNVGHSVLSHFLSGDVRAVENLTEKWRISWTIQVGPFAQHVIGVEKKYNMSKVLTLTVDGQLLCESLAEDIESRPDWWECSFRLVGERHMDWEVYESNGDGKVLDTTGVVKQKMKYSHECIVSIPDGEKDVTAARLTVDEVDFTSLPNSREPPKEEKLSCAPEALQGSYGLHVPYKVDDAAPTGIQAWTSALGCSNARRGGNNAEPDIFSSLFRCCGSPKVTRDDIVMSR